MKNFFIVILFLILAIGCSTQKDYVKLKYQGYFETVKNNKSVMLKKTFLFEIPKGYTFIGNDYNPEYKEHLYKYHDSSMLYITNNNISGSSMNGTNRLSKGIDVVSKRLNDTIVLSGQQKNNKFWKEVFYNDIVIGYLNVSELRKEEFDKAIISLKRK